MSTDQFPRPSLCQVVEPKIAKLREAEAELKLATKEKNAAEERMAKVQSKLDEMQAQFDAAMAHKQALEDDAAATQRKMDSANALIGALAGAVALSPFPRHPCMRASNTVIIIRFHITEGLQTRSPT